MALGQVQILLLYKPQHGALRQFVERTLADHPLAAGVDAEEEVGYDADNGNEPYHQRPGHGLGGLAVV